MRRHRVLLAPVAAAFLAVIPAQAALLVYEPFDYTAGVTLDKVAPNASTFGLNTGVNYSGNGADGFTVLSSSLEFEGLLTKGGSVSFAGGTKVASAPLAIGSAPYTGLLYASYLVSLSARGSGTQEGVTVRVADNNAANGDRFNLQADSRNSSTHVAIEYAGGTSGAANSGVTLELEQTYLMIGRFSNVGMGLTADNPGVATAFALTPQQFASFIAAGGADAYLDTATIGDGPNQITARAVNTQSSSTYTFNTGNFFALVGVAATGIFDEVRYGTTLQDVTPVPEPSTAFLLATGIGLALGRRRRSL